MESVMSSEKKACAAIHVPCVSVEEALSWQVRSGRLFPSPLCVFNLPLCHLSCSRAGKPPALKRKARHSPIPLMMNKLQRFYCQIFENKKSYVMLTNPAAPYAPSTKTPCVGLRGGATPRF